MTYNYFLAIALDPTLRQECLNYALDATREPLVQRTTGADNLHITVGYIGAIKKEDLNLIQTAFAALEKMPPFVLKFKQLECFGYGKNYRRYLGIEIQDLNHHFQNLYAHAFKLIKPWGYEFQGKGSLRPHITVQLLKAQGDLSQAQIQFMTQSFYPTVFKVHKLGLWYREPTLKRYISIQDYNLQGM